MIALILLALVVLPLGCLLDVVPSGMDLRLWNRNFDRTAPIELYAKVVDEAGDPVPGADVRVRLRQQNHLSLFGGGDSWRQTYVTLKSDEDGRVSISRHRGTTIYVIDVSKLGYRWLFDLDSSSNRVTGERRNTAYYFGSSGYSADKDRPAIFPLYRVDDDGHPLVKEGALPSRGGSDEGIPNQPQKPRRSSLSVTPQEARRWLPK